MNHIPFELAQMRRDELMRLASERRLVSRPALSADLMPRAMRIRRRRRVRRLRIAARG